MFFCNYHPISTVVLSAIDECLDHSASVYQTLEFIAPIVKTMIGWSWNCSNQGCWTWLNSWRACSSVQRAARLWVREVFVIFQTMHNSTGGWCGFWIQKVWRRNIWTTSLYLQRKESCQIETGNLVLGLEQHILVEKKHANHMRVQKHWLRFFILNFFFNGVKVQYVSSCEVE